MKKFTSLSRVLDGFRSSSSSNQGGSGGSPTGAGSPSGGGKGDGVPEIAENLRGEHFQVAQTFSHGFPYQPTAIAYDPLQKLLAIGTKSGFLRILGRPGVDIHATHNKPPTTQQQPAGGAAGPSTSSDHSHSHHHGPPHQAPTVSPPLAILHLQFVINSGLLISATSDDTIHLWNFKDNKTPEVVQSLKFQKERITTLNLPFQSKWIYVGTERGNVHVVNLDTFQLSGYVVNWNKAIEVSRKTHPGGIIFLGDCPTDSTKLLIGYDSGQIVLWDLKLKAAELRFQASEPMRSMSWHSDGKQFMGSHSDGSITTWNVRSSQPVGVVWPHSRTKEGTKPEPCKSIQKVEWKSSSKTSDNFVIFTGGLPTVTGVSTTPSLTVIHGKTTTLLEMEHPVLDFVVICEAFWDSEPQDPLGIIVLLENDLVIIDLLTPGYPCFENQYPMDIHESPVTCCHYIVDPPGDLIPALYSVGSMNKGTQQMNKPGLSERDCPINGGSWSSESCSYSEIVLTGHSDGSIKFWDASSTNLQFLYKLKTSKPFERLNNKNKNNPHFFDEDPFAVQFVTLHSPTRTLALASSSCQVLLYKFRRQESQSSETTILEIPIIPWEPEPDPECNFDFSKCGDSKATPTDLFIPIRPKTGPQKKLPGFQVDLICLTPWVNGEPPGGITSLGVTINTSGGGGSGGWGVLAYGNDAGLVLVDTVSKTVLMSVATQELYGDPYCGGVASKPGGIMMMNRSPKGGDVEQQGEELVTTKSTENVSSDLRPHGPTPNLSGSLSKLTDPTSTTTDALSSEKPRSTTPPPPSSSSTSAKRKSATWSKVKGLVLSNVREQKKQETTKKSKPVSYPVSPINPSSQQDVVIEDASTTTTTSSSDTDDGDNSDDDDVTAPPPPTVVPMTREEALDAAASFASSTIVPPKKQKKDKKKKKKKKKLPTIDLRSSSSQQPSSSLSSMMMKKFQKLDLSSSNAIISRSRSSSMSSLDNITTSTEAIQCLTFAESPSAAGASKKDPVLVSPTLWIGTSFGSILAVTITNTKTSTAVTPTATIFRMKGPIVLISFLDGVTGNAVSDNDGSSTPPPQQSSPPPPPTKTLSSESDKCVAVSQFAIFLSEKQARVVLLPQQQCLYKMQICETSFVIKGVVTSVKDSPCLVTYLSNGHLKIYSLPSLRPLGDFDFVPITELSFHNKLRSTKSGGGSGALVDPMLRIWGQQVIVNEDTDSIAKTFSLSTTGGHGIYLSSPSEIQKFTVAAEFSHTLPTLLGKLYTEVEMPERPKESFVAGLLFLSGFGGGGVKNVDREELFGESAAGKPAGARSVAKHIPGSSGGTTQQQQQQDHLQMRSGTVAGDVQKTRMLMVERGQKLGDLGDKTERMMNESENFSSAAHQLMLKYKDKKWYQL